MDTQTHTCIQSTQAHCCSESLTGAEYLIVVLAAFMLNRHITPISLLSSFLCLATFQETCYPPCILPEHLDHFFNY